MSCGSTVPIFTGTLSSPLPLVWRGLVLLVEAGQGSVCRREQQKIGLIVRLTEKVVQSVV